MVTFAMHVARVCVAYTCHISVLSHRAAILKEETQSVSTRLAAEKDPAFYSSGAALVEVERLEPKFDRSTIERLRKSAWLRALARNHTILIDTPDYSKTDRRLMAKDLEEIHWLWPMAPPPPRAGPEQLAVQYCNNSCARNADLTLPKSSSTSDRSE